MSEPFSWLPQLLAQFDNEHVLIRGSSHLLLKPAHVIHVEIEDWKVCIRQIAKQDCRWCAIWAEQEETSFTVSACYEKQGDYLVLLTEVESSNPILLSQTRLYPAANRAERHIQDMFGIIFINHPDNRRWTRHQAWEKHDHPLRKSFPLQGVNDNNPAYPTPADYGYSFLSAQGSGVYEIPVGPVHAGIIEPGHFRFQAVGETILNLEMHLGYVHKGIEKIAEGRDAFGLARLAGRISGDSTVAHTWAACMAMERANYIHIPPRANTLRAIMAERERIANHLGDIGAICNDVGFAFAFYQFSRLREQWQRLSQECFGHRLMMDCIIPGGVTQDLTKPLYAANQTQITYTRQEIQELAAMLDRHTGLEDRLRTTGYLSPTLARQFGCIGYVGKASGQDYDIRRDSPYAPYEQFTVEVPVLQAGDVEARMLIRIREILSSLTLLTQLIDNLPNGAIHQVWQIPFESAEGLGIVEGWRGEIITYVRFGQAGKISRFFPRDPSWLIWPALELCIPDNIVPDFPVCNKSINGSYSGQDL